MAASRTRSEPPPEAWSRRRRWRVEAAASAPAIDDDPLAVEEPMEIRVSAERGGRRRSHSVAITMRTPGHDFELAAGFLLSEGVIEERAAIGGVRYCDAAVEGDNVVEVTLAPGVDFDPARFSRHVYTSSSCGVCGKASLEILRALRPQPPGGELRVARSALTALPGRLRAAQPVFSRTGGLHAAARFDAAGELQEVREDVGRHNALDKVIGALLFDDGLPAAESIVMVSGRASFELVQKAAMAGVPVLAAVGAASSLAVEAATELGMTLVGFLREDRFNLYSGPERIVGLGGQAAHQ